MIRIEKAHIGYSTPLISFENLELNQGEIYVLIGRNGAGKSTFLKTLTREIPLLSGSISLEEIPLNELSRVELPKYISFVTSHFPTIDFLKAEEYIGLGRSPYTNFIGKLSENDLKLVDEVIEQLGIEHLKGRFTSELSDGEKQLVAIAKALAQESKYILLDEPTAFLDYPNKIHVIDVLKKVANELNRCIVFSSHDLELCLDKISHFLVIHDRSHQLDLHISPHRDQLISHAFSLNNERKN